MGPQFTFHSCLHHQCFPLMQRGKMAHGNRVLVVKGHIQPQALLSSDHHTTNHNTGAMLFYQPAMIILKSSPSLKITVGPSRTHLGIHKIPCGGPWPPEEHSSLLSLQPVLEPVTPSRAKAWRHGHFPPGQNQRKMGPLYRKLPEGDSDRAETSGTN